MTGRAGEPNVGLAHDVPGFVGRERAIARLRDALMHPGSLVLVEGEAGIGKSRLVQEYLDSPAACCENVLFGMCPPFREPFTLGPIVAAIRQYGEGASGRQLDGLAGALRPLFPEWSDDLPPMPEPLQDTSADRHRLFAALANLLAQLRITLLVLEDVHWADETTLEFLLQLTSHQPAALRLVVTYRPEEVTVGSSLRRLSSHRPASHCRDRLTLSPLDVTTTAMLASSMLDGEDVATHFARSLHEHTEGVPLAVEESVRLLQERGDLVRRDGGWERRGTAELDVPPIVRDSVLERVQPLSADTRRLIQALAVLAEPAQLPMVAAVGELTLVAAQDAVVTTVKLGLLREDDDGRLSFRHVLAAKAVYEALPGAVRRRLHLKAGHALEKTEPLPVARLVRHFRKAGDVGNWALYGELAADVAIGASDDTTGVLLLKELVSSDDLPAKTRLRLAKKLATTEVFRRCVDSGLVRQVVETLRSVLDSGLLTNREAAEIRSPLGRLLMQMADFEAGRRELELAIPDLDHDPAEATRAMVYLGFPYGSSWHANTHIEWLQRAAERAPSSLSPLDRLTLTMDRMTTLLLLGEESGWELAAEIPAAVSSAKEGLQATRGHGNAGHAAMLWGRYQEARRQLRMALEMADSGRFERIHDPILATAAHLDWFMGEWVGLAERVERIGADDGERLPRLEALLVAGMLEASGGNHRQAEDRFRQLLDEVQPQHVPDLFVASAAALARLHLANGQIAEAIRVTAEPTQEVTSKGAWVWATEIVPVRVEALVAAGKTEEAHRLVTTFARGVHGRDAPAATATLLQCRAIIAQARRDHPAQVAQRFAEVAVAWNALPRPYDAYLARERQARCLLAAGDAASAVAALSRAREGLLRLGALHDADRVVATLRECGVDVRRAQRGGRRSYGDRLSPRELEVVSLLVRGRTNREIAEILVLSPKTVARHLDSARRKLDVSSRTALAVKAVEAGIVADDYRGHPLA
ncbi:MAG: helix-turn-helix transcriptional regulator [Nocardioidaceae bacterium]